MPLKLAFDPAAKVSAAGQDGALALVDVSGITNIEVDPGNIAVFSWQGR